VLLARTVYLSIPHTALTKKIDRLITHNLIAGLFYGGTCVLCEVSSDSSYVIYEGVLISP